MSTANQCSKGQCRLQNSITSWTKFKRGHAYMTLFKLHWYARGHLTDKIFPYSSKFLSGRMQDKLRKLEVKFLLNQSTVKYFILSAMHIWKSQFVYRYGLERMYSYKFTALVRENLLKMPATISHSQLWADPNFAPDSWKRLIGSLWVPLFLNQSECSVCFSLLHWILLFLN